MYCILFDLDGVLVDTHPLMTAALRDVAHQLGLTPDPQNLAAAAALSPGGAVQRCFHGYPDARARFRRAVDAGIITLAPCLGVPDLLKSLRGDRLGVVTSRNRQDAERYLTTAGLRSSFSAVITWGDTVRHKPNPDPLQEATRRLGASAGVYVGDTPDDMRAATAAGFVGIGAMWASQWTADDLCAAGATWIASQPHDLASHLYERSAL